MTVFGSGTGTMSRSGSGSGGWSRATSPSSRATIGHPDAAAQNPAAVARIRGIDATTAATAPARAYSSRCSSTQSSLPSGSASTTHGTSRLADVDPGGPGGQQPLDDGGLVVLG